MTSPKAEFNSPPTFTDLVAADAPSTVKNFSDTLRKELWAIFNEGAGKAREVDNALASGFVAEIVTEAHWAIGEIADAQRSLTRQALRAECHSVVRRARDLSRDLRRLSPDFDALLGAHADPLGCADKLEVLIEDLEAADDAIDVLPRQPRFDESYHAIALEMAVRVLRAAKSFGLTISATRRSYWRLEYDVTEDYGAGDDGESQYISVAIQLLAAIGRDLHRMFRDSGLALSDLSWRDIVIEAKAAAPDLQ